MAYINDVHILWYVLVAFLGGVIGQFIEYINLAFLNERKILSKETYRKYKLEGKINYWLIIINAVMYILLLYRFKLSLDFARFCILTPMLISAFIIDYKIQIIPNRLNLTMFEIGLVIAFLYGLSDVAITINMALGMLAGGGIFLLITLVGGVIYGKEAMGFGDVKLMGALGLYFGLSNIIAITLVSFLIGAVLSVILLITKIKKMDEYIPFGPFIVLGTFISIFVPFETIKYALLMFFTLGLYAK